MAKNPKPLRRAWKRAKRNFERKFVPVRKIQVVVTTAIGCTHGFNFIQEAP